jgi:hypothetical protein
MFARWNPSSIFAGVAVSQIKTPGTAAQTKIVRIISQTAVIFSTIDPIHLDCVI